jgi:hypothetical protein
MVATVWIVRTSAGQKTLIQGITHAIINKDDTTVNEAQAIAAAHAAAVAAGIPLYSTYFDSAAQWDDTGEIDADDDMILFGGNAAVEAIA